MNSRVASDLMKQRRVVYREEAPDEHFRARMVPSAVEVRPLTKAADRTTPETSPTWSNRPVMPKLPPPTRPQQKSIFRRYRDGTLEYGWGRSLVEESLRVFRLGVALTENQALSLASTFPEIHFNNLPQEVVDYKAYLSPVESATLRRQIPQGAQMAALALVGDG